MARSTLCWGRPVRRGLLSSLFTVLFLILISALIFHFTSLSECYLPLISLFILGISTFVGGLVGAREAGISGLFHGIIIGTIFFILVAILALIIAPTALAIIQIIKKLLVCVICGALGGLIGVALS